MFLGWYCDDKKKSITQKIEDARARYLEKFGVAANYAMINGKDVEGYTTAIEGVTVVAPSYIRPNHIWVGQREKADALSTAAQVTVLPVLSAERKEEVSRVGRQSND